MLQSDFEGRSRNGHAARKNWDVRKRPIADVGRPCHSRPPGRRASRRGTWRTATIRRGACSPARSPIRSPQCEKAPEHGRSEEHTSELQSLMRISYAVFCLKKKKIDKQMNYASTHTQ